MSDKITIDGQEEHAFRRSIENMLRHGRADEAANKLKSLLAEHAGDGKILPARMLDITVDDLSFPGWDELPARLEQYDRPEQRITAVGIGISDPDDLGLRPDEDGLLAPPLETTFFSDSAYPFSDTDRDDLLEGYSAYGCEWQGNFEHSDDTLRVDGIDDLYGAIATLENKVARSDIPSNEDIKAGAIGACYLGVLVYQAARKAIIDKGLPRPLAMLLVNSDAYPFFDAPVMTCDEYLDNGEIKEVAQTPRATSFEDEDEEMAGLADESASLTSLVGASINKAKKTPVLVLEGEEAGNPLGMADELVAQAAYEPQAFEPQAFSGRDEFVNLDYSDTAFDPPGVNEDASREDSGPSGDQPPLDTESPAATEPPFPEDASFFEEPPLDAEPPALEEPSQPRETPSPEEPAPEFGQQADEPVSLDNQTPQDDSTPADIEPFPAEDRLARPKKSPINFDSPFVSVSGINSGGQLPDEDEDAGSLAGKSENWLDDWRDVTEPAAGADSGVPADSDQPAGRSEKWLDDWREITEPRQSAPEDQASADSHDTEAGEPWLDDWREITDRPEPPAPEGTPADTDMPAGVEWPQEDDPSEPAAEQHEDYDFHRLEEEISAALPEQADDHAEGLYLSGDVPFPMQAADPVAPATHSIRDRVRLAAPVEEQPPILVRIAKWIANLIKRVQESMTRS